MWQLAPLLLLLLPVRTEKYYLEEEFMVSLIINNSIERILSRHFRPLILPHTKNSNYKPAIRLCKDNQAQRSNFSSMTLTTTCIDIYWQCAGSRDVNVSFFCERTFHFICPLEKKFISFRFRF